MSEASPRPWRLSDSDPCIIHDAEGHLVGALWSRMRGEGRGRADASLIVAAVNALEAQSALVAAVDRAFWEVMARYERSAAATCDRPLEHAPGCECGQL